MLVEIEKPVAVDAVHRIEIERIGTGVRGPRFRVWHRDEVLIESARDPEHAACRALAARGLTGRLVSRWKDAAHDAMSMDIAWGAGRRAAEGDRQGLRFAKWNPPGHPGAEEDQD